MDGGAYMQLDEFTLQRAIKGDKQAFEEIVRIYQDRVYGISLRMLSNTHEAEDCAQETFIKIYRNLPRFEKRSSFSTWVYRIAMNCALDMIRKKKAQQNTDSLEEMVDQGFAPIETGIGPEESAINELTNDSVKEAIALLPEDQRAVIVLRDINGRTYEEIADITGANLNTVKSRISRGRQQLRKMLLNNTELFEFPCV